jgi:hypothetical protein
MLGLIFFLNDILVVLRCNLNEKKIYLSLVNLKKTNGPCKKNFYALES